LASAAFTQSSTLAFSATGQSRCNVFSSHAPPHSMLPVGISRPSTPREAGLRSWPRSSTKQESIGVLFRQSLP
jgi:hypothetical protein